MFLLHLLLLIFSSSLFQALPGLFFMTYFVSVKILNPPTNVGKNQNSLCPTNIYVPTAAPTATPLVVISDWVKIWPGSFFSYTILTPTPGLGQPFSRCTLEILVGTSSLLPPPLIFFRNCSSFLPMRLTECFWSIWMRAAVNFRLSHPSKKKFHLPPAAPDLLPHLSIRGGGGERAGGGGGERGGGGGGERGGGGKRRKKTSCPSFYVQKNVLHFAEKENSKCVWIDVQLTIFFLKPDSHFFLPLPDQTFICFFSPHPHE